MTKKQQYSVERLMLAIWIIEETVPLERKRFSMKRKKTLEDMQSIFRCHCDKLGLQTPRLGTFYDQEEYLRNAHNVQTQLREKGFMTEEA